MTVAGGVLYARLGGTCHEPTAAEHHRRSDERLVGIDLARKACSRFRRSRTTPLGRSTVRRSPTIDVCTWRCGTATCSPVRTSPRSTAATGRRLWRTFLAAADTPAARPGRRDNAQFAHARGRSTFREHQSRRGGGRVDAATDASTGSAATTAPLADCRSLDRSISTAMPSPCVYHQGLVFVAPADSPQVFALDADNGQTIWANDRLAGVVHLLGVAGGPPARQRQSALGA